MNKEIEFRGRCLKTGKWVYGSAWITLYNSYILELIDETIKAQNPISIIRKTLGQYSGVKDIEGEKIYEGDEVKNEAGEVGGIYFNNGSFWIGYYDEPAKQSLSDFVKLNTSTDEYYSKIKLLGKML